MAIGLDCSVAVMNESVFKYFTVSYIIDHYFALHANLILCGLVLIRGEEMSSFLNFGFLQVVQLLL